MNTNSSSLSTAQKYSYFMPRQFTTVHLTVLAIVSLIGLLTFIAEIIWNRKQNKILNNFIRKFFSSFIIKLLQVKTQKTSHKFANLSSKSLNLKKGTQPYQKNNEIQRTIIFSQKKDELMNRNYQMGQNHQEEGQFCLVKKLDQGFNQTLNESALKPYLKEIKHEIVPKDKQLKSSQSILQFHQNLSTYQPFLIICLFLTMHTKHSIIQLPTQQNHYTYEQNPNQIIQYFVVIAMLLISFILYLLINASNLFLKIITSFEHKNIQPSPQNSLKSNNLSVNPLPVNKEPSGNLPSDNQPKISFKFKNSLNLLNLIFTIPLFIAIGITISLKF